MQQNSFQKNGFLNVKNVKPTSLNNNFGRRNIQDIRDDMLEAKTRKLSNSVNNSQDLNKNNNSLNNNDIYRQRVENLRNFDRWK